MENIKTNEDASKPKLGGIFQQQMEDLMAERNLSQIEVAKSLGISRGVVSDWLNAKKAPSAETLITISKKLNVSVDYLLGLQTEQTTDADIKAVCKKTGLSEKSALTLVDIKEAVESISRYDDYYGTKTVMNSEIIKLELINNFIEGIIYGKASHNFFLWKETEKALKEFDSYFQVSLLDTVKEDYNKEHRGDIPFSCSPSLSLDQYIQLKKEQKLLDLKEELEENRIKFVLSLLKIFE